MEKMSGKTRNPDQGSAMKPNFYLRYDSKINFGAWQNIKKPNKILVHSASRAKFMPAMTSKISKNYFEIAHEKV